MNRAQKKEEFIAKAKQGATNAYNSIDEFHTPLWQLAGFPMTGNLGFENVMANIFLDKKQNKVSVNYRFKYPDGRKSHYDLKAKDGTIWHDFNQTMVDEVKRALKESFQKSVDLVGELIKFREIEYTGRESLEEVLQIMQKSGLMNIATVDNKTGEVTVNEDFDELNL